MRIVIEDLSGHQMIHLYVCILKLNFERPVKVATPLL